MEIDVNAVIQELVAEVADKVRQIAILRAQIKQYEAERVERVAQDTPEPGLKAVESTDR